MELLKEIWQTAQRNKLRTALTGFAVAWGIFMLIVLLGAGNGLINAQMQQSNRFLSNSMMVFGGQTSKPYQGLKEGRNIELRERDIATTKSNFQENIDEVGANFTSSFTNISYGQQYIASNVQGIYPTHPKINKIQMLCGRFVNDIDMKDKRKVIVLSDKQAKELLDNDNYKALLEKYIKVGPFAFQVIGIFQDDESRQNSPFAPYSTIKSIYGANNDHAGNIEFTFHGLLTAEDNEAFEKEYRQHLNANHQAAPDDESSIWLWNRYTQNMQMNTGISIIQTALWIIGLFTLLSGIVGVSNIMLITVKERTREFGIRKAIGARPWSVLRLIIAESVVITSIFGYIGMLLGIAANQYMDATLGHKEIDTGLFKATMFVDPTVGLDTCIKATAVIIIAGTIAGLIPAIKAARIRPIEALRAE